MIIFLSDFYNLCEAVIGNYCIFVESESIVYDDYGDFIGSHPSLASSDSIFVSLCINGPSIQINAEVIYA